MHSTGFALAGWRSGFALGLSTGLVVASAAFILFGQVSPPATTVDVVSADEPDTSADWHSAVADSTLQDAVRASAAMVPGIAETQGRLAVATSSAERSNVDGATRDLLARAEDHRRKRQFDLACEAYAAAARRGGMTADAWADYADAQASLAGKLTGAPARSIDAALAIDPGHAKALWLKASLAHEERRYDDALATWRRLQTVLPPGSSDARIVEANIAEAQRLARS
jgi:cytochrome c-type biogenesis protein CcmH/NrfG